MPLPTLRDRFRGALLGLAVGDALGTTLEFQGPGSFEPVSDMTGGGPFGLRPGQWTDDTSMALCLADSLIECRGFNARDQMDRYVSWYRQGHLSSTGTCFDIGGTVRSALVRYERTGEPCSGSTDPQSAGNGSLMRLAPVPLLWHRTPVTAVEMAALSSRTTHGAVTAVDACRLMAAILVGALTGADKSRLLNGRRLDEFGIADSPPLCPEISVVAAGSFRDREPPAIRGAGYVAMSLEAALWAFDRGDSYEECVLKAVNLGDDADTTGAICGQIAGAYYGSDSIPPAWLGRLTQADLIISLADSLLELSSEIPLIAPEEDQSNC